jgi:hypothetical protein
MFSELHLPGIHKFDLRQTELSARDGLFSAIGTPLTGLS